MPYWDYLYLIAPLHLAAVGAPVRQSAALLCCVKTRNTTPEPCNTSLLRYPPSPSWANPPTLMAACRRSGLDACASMNAILAFCRWKARCHCHPLPLPTLRGQRSRGNFSVRRRQGTPATRHLITTVFLLVSSGVHAPHASVFQLVRHLLFRIQPHSFGDVLLVLHCRLNLSRFIDGHIGALFRIMLRFASKLTISVSATGNPCPFARRTCELTLLSVFSCPSTPGSLEPSDPPFPSATVGVASMFSGNVLALTQHLGGKGVASSRGHGKPCTTYT